MLEFKMCQTNVTDGASISLAGAIPTALMAVIADLFMGWLERVLSPAKQSSSQNTVT